MPKFNGHKNWNHWNVSLWIFNDESMYRSMQYAIRKGRNREEQVEILIGILPASTPDGARFTKATVLAAIRQHERR